MKRCARNDAVRGAHLRQGGCWPAACGQACPRWGRVGLCPGDHVGSGEHLGQGHPRNRRGRGDRGWHEDCRGGTADFGGHNRRGAQGSEERLARHHGVGTEASGEGGGEAFRWSRVLEGKAKVQWPWRRGAEDGAGRRHKNFPVSNRSAPRHCSRWAPPNRLQLCLTRGRGARDMTAHHRGASVANRSTIPATFLLRNQPPAQPAWLHSRARRRDRALPPLFPPRGRPHPSVARLRAPRSPRLPPLD